MNPRIELPSAATIAKYSAVMPAPKLYGKGLSSAYSHSRYLVRKAKNYAKGLNAAGNPLVKKTNQ